MTSSRDILISNMTKTKNEGAVAMGKLAARINKKKGSAYFSALGKRGAASRWKKGKKRPVNKSKKA